MANMQHTLAEPLAAGAETCIPALLPRLTTAQATELASAFKALADPTRIQIISLLLEAGPRGRCVCDIVANFPLRQPTISHHLKVLRDAGLLRATKKGLWVYYIVERDRLAHLGIAVPSASGSADSQGSAGACDARVSTGGVSCGCYTA